MKVWIVGSYNYFGDAAHHIHHVCASRDLAQKRFIEVRDRLAEHVKDSIRDELKKENPDHSYVEKCTEQLNNYAKYRGIWSAKDHNGYVPQVPYVEEYTLEVPGVRTDGVEL